MYSLANTAILRELHTRWGGWETCDTGSVNGVGFLDGAYDLVIDGEGKSIGLPVDLYIPHVINN